MGPSLCHLVNCLKAGAITAINMPDIARDNPNLAKANIYYFLLACRNSLKMKEDQLFAISELYRDDTNGFLKVLSTVEQVLAMIEEDGKLVRQSVQGRSIRASMDASSVRDKVVMELLETERKYVADLERLQVCFFQIYAF